MIKILKLSQPKLNNKAKLKNNRIYIYIQPPLQTLWNPDVGVPRRLLLPMYPPLQALFALLEFFWLILMHVADDAIAYSSV